MRSSAWLVLVVVAVSGCAAHHPGDVASRFIQRGEPAVRIPQTAQPDDSLATWIEKVRALSAAARPTAPDSTPTIEAANADLRAALAREAQSPSADASRAVGYLYRKLRVLDLAYDHFARAIRLDGRDASSYEQMARIWRDWGFANLALGDAHRALYFAPGSPSAANTLGTVFQALGQNGNALTAYRRALALAPDAPYALNNACSALIALHKPQDALAICQRPVQVDPALEVAQRNLAAARAALGRADGQPDVGGGRAVDSESRDAGAPGTGTAHR